MGLFGKEKLEDMEGLLLAQVKDLYDAECRIIDSIPDIVEKASSNHLKNALSSHLIETIQHKKRLKTTHINCKIQFHSTHTPVNINF